ncbi:MAG: MaoC family dehydratase [Saprospiraceae bacterium]|jgi:acyl dehydratase|nr:MaoC family dehydratase [bacterium]MDC3219559.1 MaoC family dehydratase [Saprospiraceae bacterium]MDG1434183.1 MaoC family dehydratase [Saprospiraceae bacterium]MDG2419053.1 MaoC family dehydratase [Saprospiraceae bacterium]
MPKLEIENIEALMKLEGDALPQGDWIPVTQKMINAFADATLDYQWIHTDVERAKKESPFKTPIAHGFMSVSLLSKMLEEAVIIKSGKMGVNYGLNNVRFPHPVPAGSRLRLNGKINKVEAYGDNGCKIFWGCSVEIEGVEKPACVGEFISLLFE